MQEQSLAPIEKSGTAADPAPRLALDYITLDARLQSRQLKPAVVEDYLSAMRRGDEFPPVRVVRDSEDHYYLVDGHHRVAAARQLLGIDGIAVEIIQGTFTDALWLSWGANRNHGLRPSREDKRRAILAALQHPEWSKKSDRAIAQHIGCDNKTVAALRHRVAAEEFLTQAQVTSSPCSSGPSKRGVLQAKRVFLRACRLIAELRPEQAPHFDQVELGMLKAAYESLGRLLGGAATVNTGQPNHTESEGETNGNSTQN